MDKMNTRIVPLSVWHLCLAGFAVTQAIIAVGTHSDDLSAYKRQSLLTISFQTKTKHPQKSGAREKESNWKESWDQSDCPGCMRRLVLFVLKNKLRAQCANISF